MKTVKKKRTRVHVGPEYNEAYHWNKRYYQLKQDLEYFKVTPQPLSAKELKDSYEDEVEITHLECGSTFTTELKTWRQRKSKIKVYTDDPNTYLCPTCFQNKKNSDFQKQLDKKYKGGFLLKSDFIRNDKYHKIHHKDCGHTFEIRPIIFENSILICPNCNKTEQSAWYKYINDNNEKLKILLEESKLEYLLPLDDYTNNVSLMRFKDLRCGHTFEYLPTKIKHLIGKDCPECAKEKRKTENKINIKNKRNLDFQKQLDKKYKGSFLLNGDYTQKGKYHKIYHKDCGHTFEARPITFEKSILICPNCNKTEQSAWDEYINDNNQKLKKFLKENELEYLLPIEDCVNSINKMKFKDLRCGHTIECSPKFIKEQKNRDCPTCVEEKSPTKKRNVFKTQSEKNQYFQNTLNELNKPYTLISDYIGGSKSIEAIHNLCGKANYTLANKLLKASYKCPYCEDATSLKKSTIITSKEKKDIYEKELGYKYEILSYFTSITQKVNVKHLKCETEFPITLRTLLNSKNKEICPHCKSQLKLEEYLHKLEEKFKGSFALKNPEDFKDSTSKLTFKHSCGSSYKTSFPKLLSKKLDQCPNCDGKINSTARLKNYVFKRFKGEYLVVSEFISSITLVKFKHKKCDKTFQTTPGIFQASKSPCPYCSNSKDNAESKLKDKFGKLFKLCGIYVNMSREMTIMCNNCLHVFEDNCSNLLKKDGCKNCGKTHL